MAAPASGAGMSQRLATSGVSVGSGVLVAWAWNASVPEVPMPAEVAAAIGAVIAPLFDVVVALRDVALERLAGRVPSACELPADQR